ncbi:MAG TPA: lysophospholipid acyltransferase family protein [Anaeromyxobacteraceae bacterium]|nr:lysophospholipid acyltransferase family protein [Anaeromyxobacteraceae bacterium]
MDVTVGQARPAAIRRIGLGARARGFATLAYTIVSAFFFIVLQLPALLAGSASFSIWLARRWWSPWALRVAGAKVEVVRLAEEPQGPAVYASNHQSALDIWALFIAIRRDVRFLAKAELFQIPIFGWYLRRARFVEVDRRNHARAVASLTKGAEIVRDGVSLIVFPEGTRSVDGRVQSFKKGPFVLAERAGVPVIPVAISGAAALAPKGRIAVFPGTIRIAIGPAVDPAEFKDKDALLREVHRRIVEQQLAIGGPGGDAEGAVAARGQEGGRNV